MKAVYAFLVLFVLCGRLTAQQAPSRPPSAINSLSYGVVLDNPGTKDVIVTTDVTYLDDGKNALHADIYSPSGLRADEKRPAIIFLNGVGDDPGQAKVKSWGQYTSWPKLIAAYGYIGISMESDGKHIQESIAGLFKFIAEKGGQYHINTAKLGVFACSANVSQSAAYLMSDKAYPGIKAAVLYYGFNMVGPFRTDLPVMFVISEGDAQHTNYGYLLNEALKNKAPWTIKIATGMPHAFDVLTDNDDARKIIMETIAFWQTNLNPVPQPSWPPSVGRDIMGSMQMDKPKAVTLLKPLYDKNPEDKNVATLYASVLSDTRQFAEAENVFKKILASDPQNSYILTNLADLCFSQNKMAEGEKYVLVAENSGNMDHYSYARLGRSLLALNKNEEAAMYFEKAIAIEPIGGFYYDLGCAYAKENEKDKAFAALNNAIKYGVVSRTQYEADGDLTSLKSDERFKELLSKAR